MIVRYKIVQVTNRFVGFHRWPDAPEHRKYLRERHRHEFIVTTAVVVDDPDRQVEFHDLQAEVNRAFKLRFDQLLQGMGGGDIYDFKIRSCEQIALDALEYLDASFNYKLHMMKVSEDGENAALVFVE